MSHVCDGESGALRRFRLIVVEAKAAIIAWEKTHGIMNRHVDTSPEGQAGNQMKDSESDAVETRPEEIVVNKERFLRWQRLAIDQLGFTLNFILTLTIAALGYIFSSAQGQRIHSPTLRKVFADPFSLVSRNRCDVRNVVHHQSTS